MTLGGGHSDTAARASQSPVSNALKIRAHLHLNSATISRVSGRKLGRLKPNNPLWNVGGTLSVTCLYYLKDQCNFNTTVHKIKYSGRNKLLYHVTVSCLVGGRIKKC